MSKEKLEQIEAKIDKLSSMLLFKKSILNFDEAVLYTGYSKSYFYRICHLIPHSKPSGKMIFFERKKIDEFLISNRIKTPEEIEELANDYMQK
ncbi:hypothetical protein [Marinifilum sp. D737]|uniref:hypothetical protein n=1 Tax=Marinifilum sp. D737 TaxID=2969628 RepID=UPI00227447B4|nr:hypothetical protein [Marinifilum sp. D737]MCY1633911.1 hypothetical protein [Marinifilum sp. D737]